MQRQPPFFPGLLFAIILALCNPGDAISAEEKTLNGASCNINTASHMIGVVPWDQEKGVWEFERVEYIKLLPETVIQNTATVSDIDSHKAIITQPFEVKQVSQLLHRVVSISYHEGSSGVAEATSLVLPLVLPGMKFPFPGPVDIPKLVTYPCSGRAAGPRQR